MTKGQIAVASMMITFSLLVFVHVLVMPVYLVVSFLLNGLESSLDGDYTAGFPILLVAGMNAYCLQWPPVAVVLFIIETAVSLYLTLLDPDRTEKRKLATDLEISLQDPRIDKAFRHLTSWPRSEIKSTDELDEMLRRAKDYRKRKLDKKLFR